MSEAAEAMKVSLSVALQPDGIVYKPQLLAQAQVRYLAARYNFEYQRPVTAMVGELPGSIVTWENYAWKTYRPADLQNQPLPQTRFMALPGWLVSCLGNRAYGLYERLLQAATPLARRLQP